MTQEKVAVILGLIVLVVSYIGFYSTKGKSNDNKKPTIKSEDNVNRRTSGEYLISAGKKFNASIIYSFLGGLTGLIGWLMISEAKTNRQIQDTQTITIVITLISHSTKNYKNF